ncbi:fungal-specific transcription factor domain-containing protein [Chaetomium sp. MPI-SDFR-AT-0129]|nr:fungal-specific transcription factor domain-containing protein [Chaetomium sp. MPI-SDFR-AT-0129]
MSLADDTPSALAARHAIAALSYQHLAQREAAVLHQTKALGALQTVINSISSGNMENMQAFRAMAASMLLNIFETLNFDASSLSWAMFFCGCKKIVNLFHTPHTSYEGDSAMILDWIFYHDTFYKFSVRHWYPKEKQQILLAQHRKVISKAVFSPLRQIILPSTGCSLELLDLICQTVDAVLERDDSQHLSPSHLQTIRRLELRLEALIQTPRITTVTSSNTPENTGDLTPTDPAAATTTPTHQQETHLAELYRLATHIYLLRMARALPPTHPLITPLVSRALTLLRHPSIQHHGCARPWPLFIIALEVGAASQHETENGSEDARSVVSGAIEAARRRRPLGNFVLVRRLVHAAWVQMDLGLGGDDKGGEDLKRVYDVVVSGVRVPPSFT